MGLNNFGRNFATEVCQLYFFSKLGKLGSKVWRRWHRSGRDFGVDSDPNLRTLQCWSPKLLPGNGSTDGADRHCLCGSSTFWVLWFSVDLPKKRLRLCCGAPSCWACIFYGVACVYLLLRGPVFPRCSLVVRARRWRVLSCEPWCNARQKCHWNDTDVSGCRKDKNSHLTKKHPCN